jgi:two-component system cell cycle sensor histidine kinase/response regulator CckA
MASKPDGSPEGPGTQYASLLRHARDTILVIQDGVVKYVNRPLERSGHTVEELTGTPLEAMPAAPPPSTVDLQSIREAWIAGQEIPLHEAQVVAKDGTVIDVEVSIGFTEYDGKPAGVSVVRDISDRRQAEAALRESEERFRCLSEAAFEGIAIHKDGRIVMANQAFCRMTGYNSPDEVVGLPILQFATPETRELVARNVAAGHEKPYEVVGVRRDGSHIPVELVGKNTAYLGAPARVTAMRDITERRQAETARQEMEQQVQHAQKLESLGVLAGGIAHDFNNLLVGVVGNASMLLDDLPLDSPLRSSIEEIELAGQQAAELTRQLLAYSGKGKIAIEPLDLSQLVSEMTQLLKTSISKKVTLRCELDRQLPLLRGDHGQLRQVVMNLVTNAAEAMGDAGGVVTLRTGVLPAATENDATLVSLEVSDEGCGIDAETREKIFDPFFSTKFTGRGLGLAAVLGIVRSHDGTINVSSEPRRGSTFTVCFPATEERREGARPRPEATVPTARGGTILVVDDEEIVRRTAQRILEGQGFRVLLADNGSEGVTLFRRHADEIRGVLLDATMPLMDGAEAVGELRRIQSDVRILLSSGYDEQDVASRFEGLGCAATIQKPYTALELVQKMLRVIEGRPAE